VNGGATSPVKVLEVLSPLSGLLQLDVVGTGCGDYTLDFVAYDNNGVPTVTKVTGHASNGSLASFQIFYSTQGNDPASLVTSVSPVAALVAGVQNARSAGQIDDDGITNSLLAKLNAAGQALEQGHVQAARGSLGSFVNELSAQSGKRVSPATANALTALATQFLGRIQ
jgi:hypothetical protein